MPVFSETSPDFQSDTIGHMTNSAMDGDTFFSLLFVRKGVFLAGLSAKEKNLLFFTLIFR